MGRRRKGLFGIRLNPKSSRSAASLLLILAAFLATASYLGQITTVQNSLQTFINQFFGVSAIFFPLFLFLAGLSLTRFKWELAKPRIFLGFSLFYLSILGSLALFSTIDNQLLKDGQGGLIGYYLAHALTSSIGFFGAFLAFGITLIIALIITFNTSLDEIFYFVKEKFGFMGDFLEQHVFAKTLEFLKNNQEKTSVATETKTTVEEREIKIHGSEDTTPEIEIVTEETSKIQEPISAPAPSLAQPSTEVIEYQLPPLTLLSEPEKVAADRGDIQKNAKIIEKTLGSFGIVARVAEVNLGPAVTQYALELTEGTKISKITALQNDLALALAAPTGTVRIEAPIPGKSLVGVEVPNYSPTLVTLKSILTADTMLSTSSKLTVALGQNVAGEPVIADAGRWPHVLIAGATGSGKSVLLHSLISTILFRTLPTEVKLILVDPKRVELTRYNNIPHLLTPVITESEKVIAALKWSVAEMEKRYKLFQKMGARNLADYNQRSDQIEPYILIIVDELADLMAFAASEFEALITRIAQMSRATGIHLVLSTQRPSVDVLTGLIKANIPTRIALNVSSGTDSRVIIDMTGAEKLLGRGDMLYLPPDLGKPIRIQGVFVSDHELKSLLAHWQQYKTPVEVSTEELTRAPDLSPTSTSLTGPEDELFTEALRVIINHDKASASLLQRRLRIGYARAARILDELEERRMIGPKDGSNPREVYTQSVREYLDKSENRFNRL